MITFLRKIRRSLVESGSVQKYVLYAIGEILLVMIGILFALQVNTWNEKRKIINTQNELLVKLKLDLKYDIDLFEKLDSIYTKWESQCDYVLNVVLSGKVEKLDNLNQYTIGRGSFYFLTLKTTTYDEMISTGNLFQLQNDQLSNSINKYYEQAKFEVEKLNRDVQNFSDYMLSPEKEFQKNIVMRLALQRNLDYIDWAWLRDPNSTLYKELETRAGWFSGQIKAYRLVLDALTDQAEKTIEYISLELQK